MRPLVFLAESQAKGTRGLILFVEPWTIVYSVRDTLCSTMIEARSFSSRLAHSHLSFMVPCRAALLGARPGALVSRLVLRSCAFLGNPISLATSAKRGQGTRKKLIKIIQRLRVNILIRLTVLYNKMQVYT